MEVGEGEAEEGLRKKLNEDVEAAAAAVVVEGLYLLMIRKVKCNYYQAQKNF